MFSLMIILVIVMWGVLLYAWALPNIKYQIYDKQGEVIFTCKDIVDHTFSSKVTLWRCDGGKNYIVHDNVIYKPVKGSNQ